ncbi:hypothetical protein MRX96_007594 [Rhipicephalus microplus]
MKLDTGAQCNVLPLKVATSIGLKLTQSLVKRIVSYTQDILDVREECIALCTVRNKPVKIKFVVGERTANANIRQKRMCCVEPLRSVCKC